jgi:purine-binding chemotaxis protein CheW
MTREMLIFLAGKERFAISASAIEAVIDMPAVRQLPAMPDGMLGVAELRGALVPVYSAARVLNVAIDEPSAGLVARAGARRVVIAVAETDGVEVYDPTAWSGIGGAAPGSGLVRGVSARDGTLTTLIDLPTFVDACTGDSARGAS